MKIIDEKGKLFGKLNIIDLLVLVLVAAVALFLGARFLGGGDEASVAASRPAYLEYTVLATEVLPETYETVKQFVDGKKGLKDQLMASDALLPGYAVDVVATPHVSYVECADGSVKVVESAGEDRRLDLLFTCVAITVDSVSNEVGTQDIRAGIPHIMKTTHFEFQGSQIISVKWLDEAPF